MSMMCQHLLSVASRIFAVRKTVMTGVVLLLVVGGCAFLKPTGKEGPKRHDMTVYVGVKDEQGNPVKDAVVYTVEKERPAPTNRKVFMVVANSAFQPFVLPVQVGSLVTFYNRDRLQHHIYSISAAKKINVLLKKGASSAPVTLDKAGIVVLGCAIHDRMVGYIYALETAHFSVTGAEGIAELTGLPLRAVDIRVWHPSMKASSETITKRVVATVQGRASIEFVVPVQMQSKAGRKQILPISRPKQGRT